MNLDKVFLFGGVRAAQYAETVLRGLDRLPALLFAHFADVGVAEALREFGENRIVTAPLIIVPGAFPGLHILHAADKGAVLAISGNALCERQRTRHVRDQRDGEPFGGADALNDVVGLLIQVALIAGGYHLVTGLLGVVEGFQEVKDAPQFRRVQIGKLLSDGVHLLPAKFALVGGLRETDFRVQRPEGIFDKILSFFLPFFVEGAVLVDKLPVVVQPPPEFVRADACPLFGDSVDFPENGVQESAFPAGHILSVQLSGESVQLPPDGVLFGGLDTLFAAFLFPFLVTL